MTWQSTRLAQRCALLLAAFLSAVSAWAAGMETDAANATFARLEQIRSSASMGDALAQFKMGDYFYAQGDFTNAVVWYGLAAEQEHRGAQLSLATCYLLGRGVAKDVEQAAHWSARARAALTAIKSPVHPTAPPPLVPEIWTGQHRN